MSERFCNCGRGMIYRHCPVHGPANTAPQPPPSGAGDEIAAFEAYLDSQREFAGGPHGMECVGKERLFHLWQAARSRPASPDLSEDYARIRRELDAAHDELRRQQRQDGSPGVQAGLA